MALDVYTGEYRWHFQEVHHDIWDYDAPNPVVLFDLDYDGVPRKGLAQAGKTGFLYILDRTNGEPLIGIEERPVPQEPRQATAATQPYPVGEPFVSQTLDVAPEGYRLINNGAIFTPFWEEPVLLRRGDANWPPSTVDPEKGVMYVCAGERQAAYSVREDLEQVEPGTPLQRWQLAFCAHSYNRNRFRNGSAHQPQAVEPALAQSLLQRLGGDGRRPVVCWPERWPVNRA